MFEKNDRVQVLDSGIWREAKIIDISTNKDSYLINFLNFTNKYNTHYPINLLRKPIEKRDIARNLLKVSSDYLNNLSANDFVSFQSSSSTINIPQIARVLENDPYKCELKVEDTVDKKMINFLSYESISLTSKQEHEFSKLLDSLDKLKNNKNNKQLLNKSDSTKRKVTTTTSLDNISILAECLPSADANNNRKSTSSIQIEPLANNTSKKKKTDLSSFEKAEFIKYMDQFGQKIRAHDATLNETIKDSTDKIVQAIRTGLKDISNNIVLNSSSLRNVQIEPFVNLNEFDLINSFSSGSSSSSNDKSPTSSSGLFTTAASSSSGFFSCAASSSGVAANATDSSLQPMSNVVQCLPSSADIPSGQPVLQIPNFLTEYELSVIREKSKSIECFAANLLFEIYKNDIVSLIECSVNSYSRQNISKKGIDPLKSKYIKIQSFRFFSEPDDKWKKCVKYMNKRLANLNKKYLTLRKGNKDIIVTNEELLSDFNNDIFNTNEAGQNDLLSNHSSSLIQNQLETSETETNIRQEVGLEEIDIELQNALFEALNNHAPEIFFD
jgi:hypothetical protein